MTRPGKEYLKRSLGTSLLPLSGLHHYVMDRIFSEFSNDFSFDDVLQIITDEDTILNSESMAGNTGRVKLLVIRALEGLIAVGMISESETVKGTYHLIWQRGE